MSTAAPVPIYTLFGETETFPDVIHCEPISDRASLHGWTISAHRHLQMAQLFAIERGSVRTQIDKQVVHLREGEYLFVPPQVVHQFDFAPDTVGMVTSLPMKIVSSIGPINLEIAQALSLPFSGPSDPKLVSLLDLLAGTLKCSGTFRAQTAVGLAHALLAHIATEGQRSERRPNQSRNLRMSIFDTLIAEKMAEGWSASEYAGELSVSVGHLNRLCQKAKGLNSKTYIETVVMEEAARLLAFTQLSVAEIGYHVGFKEPSYFSRRFRRMHRQSPSHYRRRFTD